MKRRIMFILVLALSGCETLRDPIIYRSNGEVRALSACAYRSLTEEGLHVQMTLLDDTGGAELIVRRRVYGLLGPADVLIYRANFEPEGVARTVISFRGLVTLYAADDAWNASLGPVVARCSPS